jgi:dTDP-4-dehydrorhamnose 3,5-epimerase-like enzyme
MKEMIEVPQIIEGGIFIDDRGSLSFVNDMSFDKVKRFYSIHHLEEGMIRAYHYHQHEEKFVWVAKGTFLVGAVDPKTDAIFKYVLSSVKPQILWIPKGFANGFKNLERDSTIVFFSISTKEQSLTDDIRYPWDKWNIWEENYR